MILETTRGTLNLAAKPHNPWRQYEGIATDTNAGIRVTPEDALALVAVYGAVSLIADANGTMPLETIDQRATSGRKLVEGGWMAPMLRYEPNSDMSGADLWTMVNAHLVLRGNAYLAKLKNPDGSVRELYPLMPWNVNPYRDSQGRKVFRVTVYEGDTAIDADYTPDAILHIKGKSITNPLRGESPFTHARDVIGTQLAQTEYQARAYQDGMMLKGILSVPHMNFSPDAAERVKQQWRSAYAGLGNSHDIAVLHGGATFSPVSLSPEDAQFIQTMKWTHTQIATLLKIPASRLNGEGTSLTYANQGQDDLFFDKQACLPLRIMIEQALNRDRDLFGPTSPWVPKFNPHTQLQADILTRFDVYERARRIGVMSQNDILRAEDRPEIGPEGDDYTPLSSGAAAPVESAEPDEDDSSEPVDAERSIQPITVNVTTPDVRIDNHLPAPNVTVEAGAAPDVRVEVAAAEVRVPEQPAPVVNVAPPEVRVEVAAPDVRVESPTIRFEPNVTIEQPPVAQRKVLIERDAQGRITGASTKGTA